MKNSARRLLAVLGACAVSVPLSVGFADSALAAGACNQAAWRNASTANVIIEVPVRGPAGESGSTNCTLTQSSSPSYGARALQDALIDCYGKRIARDGYFGPATRTALIQVQRAIGTAADGIYGPNTGGGDEVVAVR